MTAATKIAIGIVAILWFYGWFYTSVLKRFGPLVRPLVRRLRLDADHPVRDVEAIGKLAVAAAAQAVFAAALIVSLDVAPGFAAGAQRLQLVGWGVLLGLAELGFAVFLSAVVLHTAAAIRATPLDVGTASGRAGWMGHFGGLVAVAPVWLAGAAVIAYVTVEELVFRAILIELLRPAGAVAAVSGSVVLFVAVQAMNMPNARAALHPVVGALVVGVVHGVVYWNVADIVPLVAAHLAFFGGALLGFRRPDYAPEHR